jgi:hypothetical protein
MFLKKYLVVEIKEKESNRHLESDLENNGRRYIINVNPTATFVTGKIQLEEPTDPEEGGCLFHSQMWVKRTPLHFIVDSRIQKNLMLEDFLKQLEFLSNTTPTTIQHWVTSSGMRSSCQPTMSIVIWNPTIQG